MNCGNCGNPLIPGNPTCPSCGAINNLQPVQVASEVVYQQQPVQQVQQPVQQVQAPVMQVVEQAPLEDLSSAPLETFDSIVEQQTGVAGDSPVEHVQTENQVDESIAPPSLEVASETLIPNNTSDLGAAGEVSTYETESAPAAEPELPAQVGSAESAQGSEINFAIPAADGQVVADVNMPKDGSAPETQTTGDTVGEVQELDKSKVIKFGKKELKLNTGGKGLLNLNPTVKLILVAAMAAVVGGYVGIQMFPKKVYSGQRIETSDTKYIADGENNVTKAGLFTFMIPKAYTYDKKDKGLLIYSDNNTWRIYIRPVKASYEKMANSLQSLKNTLINKQITVNHIREFKTSTSGKTDGDRSYIEISTTNNYQNRLLAITKPVADIEDQIFYIEITTIFNDSETDENMYRLLNDIIDNVVYNEKETELEAAPLEDDVDLLVRAAEYYDAEMNKK